MSEFHKGKQLQEEGTLEEAIAAYHRTLELNSNDSWAYHHMGEALAKLGRWDEAITAYRHAIKLKPDFSWSYHHLGDALAEQQQWEESATAFRKAIELNPKHFGTYVGLGKSLEKLGQLDEAIATYRRAIELNPDGDVIHYALANTLQQRTQSDLAEAIASYRKIRELNPDNVEADHNLLQFQPENWEVWLQLGNTLVQQGKLEEAIAAYRRAIEDNPHNQSAYYGLEENLAKLRQLEEVIAAYRQAIELGQQEKQKTSTLQATEDREEGIKRYRHAIEDNPDNISVYYKLLELEPGNQEILLQLAQALVRQEQMEEAIALYRRLVELSPCEQYYQQLGELLGKLSNWDDAISCYQNALELNPKSFEFNYQLGEAIYQRIMENPESFLAEYNIIDQFANKKEYQVNEQEIPELWFINDEQFLQETNHLDDEAYTIELFKVYKRYSVSEWEKQACMNWLRQPDSSRELGIKYWRTLPDFQELIRNSGVAVGLQATLPYYHKTIELNPSHTQSFSRLGEILTRQGKVKEARQVYYNLSILLAEKGKLNEAVSYFLKAPQEPSSEANVYEKIWKGLNELAPLNQVCLDDLLDIQPIITYAYFSRCSQYTLINLRALTEKDKAFIKEVGLSLANLELIRQDNLSLEEIYINAFDPNHSTHLTQKVRKNNNYIAQEFLNNPNYFQQSLVETGYLYSICPFTAKILRSNQSFYDPAWLPMIGYRFVGKEVFYLFLGHYWSGKKMLYIPKLEIVISFFDPDDGHQHINIKEILDRLKSNTVSHWNQVRDYLFNTNKKVVLILGTLSNIGHYLWNELTGINFLYENDLLKHTDAILAEQHEFFNIENIFPELEGKVVRFNDKLSSFKWIIENNYCAVRVTGFEITEKLAERIYKASGKRCSSAFLQEVENGKKHFPLLWIGMRTHSRVWVSQVEGIANIIKSLHFDFPNLAVVFDGYSRTEREEIGVEGLIESEKVNLDKILALIPDSVKTYSIIGSMTYEKVIWANAIDLYISTPGSTTTFVLWIANKRGVVHANSVCYESWVIEQLQSRENVVMPVYIPLESIVEYSPIGLINNYDFDWRLLDTEVRKLLNNLEQVKTWT
jgi:tetratricopeptide (TPR) repeat protein